MGRFQAHRLGGQIIHGEHFTLTRGNFGNAGIKQFALVFRCGRDDARQRHTPDAAENRARIGQARIGFLYNRALVFQQPRGGGRLDAPTRAHHAR